MRRLWCRNTLLQIPVIARSKLLPHEINGLVDKMKPVSFQRGTITPTEEMKAAMYVFPSKHLFSTVITQASYAAESLALHMLKFCCSQWQDTAINNR